MIWWYLNRYNKFKCSPNIMEGMFGAIIDAAVGMIIFGIVVLVKGALQ